MIGRKNAYIWKQKTVMNHSFSVVGLHRGAGVTLFCVNFATYLAREYKARVALVNLTENGDYLKLAAMEGLERIREAETTCFRTENFKKGGVAFFCRADSSALQCIQRNQYDFFVYDIGTKIFRNENLFLSSDQKIVIGSDLPWKCCEYEQFLSFARQIETYETWQYLLMTSTGNKAVFIEDGKIKLKRVGVLPGAFDVSLDAARLYRSML